MKKIIAWCGLFLMVLVGMLSAAGALAEGIGTCHDGTRSEYVKCDSTGHLQVDVLSGASDTSAVDASTYTAATSKFGLMGAAYVASPSTLTTGKNGHLLLTADHRLETHLTTSATVPLFAELTDGSAQVGTLANGLAVKPATGAVFGGAEVTTDTAAFTAGSGNIGTIGGVYVASPGTLTTGQAGYALLDSTHRLAVTNRYTGATAAAIPTYAAFMGASDGTNLQALRIDASNNLQMTDAAVRPGENATDGVKDVRIKYLTPYTPTKETSGSIGATAVTVLASVAVDAYSKCCVYLRNLDSTDSFTDAQVYDSPDGAGTCGDANWISAGWTGADTLAAAATAKYCFTDSVKRVCAQVTAAGGGAEVSSVDAWIVCKAS